MCLKNPKSRNRKYGFQVPRATPIANNCQLTGIILIESMMPSNYSNYKFSIVTFSIQELLTSSNNHQIIHS